MLRIAFPAPRTGVNSTCSPGSKNVSISNDSSSLDSLNNTKYPFLSFSDWKPHHDFPDGSSPTGKTYPVWKSCCTVLYFWITPPVGNASSGKLDASNQANGWAAIVIANK